MAVQTGGGRGPQPDPQPQSPKWPRVHQSSTRLCQIYTDSGKAQKKSAKSGRPLAPRLARWGVGGGAGGGRRGRDSTLLLPLDLRQQPAELPDCVHPGFVDGAHLIDRELAGGAHQVFGALQVELDRADLLGPLGCSLSSNSANLTSNRGMHEKIVPRSRAAATWVRPRRVRASRYCAGLIAIFTFDCCLHVVLADLGPRPHGPASHRHQP
jgi:hypothetical protein